MSKASDWVIARLGDVTCEETSRNGHRSETNVVYGVDRTIGLTEEAKYSSADLSRYKLLRPGMFAYNPMRLNIGSIGYCKRGSPPGVVSPDYVVFSCRSDRLDPDFLHYVTKSSYWQQWVAAAGVGSVRVRIYYRELASLPLRLPPIEEQREIARILGLLDSTMELNRRMNETLEAMARALFKSWFVDFDPVRAKADGRDPGVPQPIADLFPDRFEESEAGKIPAGWRVMGLDEIARFVNGLALQKFPPTAGRSLPVIKIAQLRSGNTNGADAASADLDPDFIVEDGDVLFSWSGSLECVLWTGGRGALNQHLFKVTSSGYPKWFYYFWIHEHLDAFRAVAAGKATTMGHIQRHHLTDAKAVVPPSAVLATLDLKIEPLMESIWRRGVQSRTLAANRDALLPKLISGELRVPQAEGLLQAAPT